MLFTQCGLVSGNRAPPPGRAGPQTLTAVCLCKHGGLAQPKIRIECVASRRNKSQLPTAARRGLRPDRPTCLWARWMSRMDVQDQTRRLASPSPGTA